MWCRRMILTPIRCRRAASLSAVAWSGKHSLAHDIEPPESRSRAVLEVEMTVARCKEAVLARGRVGDIREIDGSARRRGSQTR